MNEFLRLQPWSNFSQKCKGNQKGIIFVRKNRKSYIDCYESLQNNFTGIKIKSGENEPEDYDSCEAYLLH
jgi:hypothetical protein